MSDDVWFRRARLGLFVHWGPYSQQGWEASWPLVGGVKTLPRARPVPASRYFSKVAAWRPDAHAPDRWVKAAAAAGMGYALLTTKHHDGYALWPSSHVSHGVADHHPGLDLVESFTAACRRHGLAVGLYLSLSDWHHPDYPAFREADEPYVFGAYPAPEQAAWERYIADLEGQLTELLTRYGRIDYLWFDGGWEREDERWKQGRLEALIRRLQPGILINERLPGVGDVRTPEQFVPPETPGDLWETCMTLNASWAYDPEDTSYKSATELVHVLCETVGRGGNLLLNVGPDGRGDLPSAEGTLLAELGGWMSGHSEAIAGTEPGLEPWQFYGPTTRSGNHVYCMFLMRPQGAVTVRGVPVTRFRRATELSGGEPLEVSIRRPVLDELMETDNPGELQITVPEHCLQPHATVIKLEFESLP